MSSTPIDFLLAPDATSARRIRILLAEKAPGLHRVVGTWAELMDHVDLAYLFPPGTDDWPERLRKAISEQKHMFWEASLKIAPRETLAELEQAIGRMLDSAPVGDKISVLIERLPSGTRLSERLAELASVLEAAGNPSADTGRLDQMKNVSRAPLRPIRVYCLPEFMDFTPWQEALVERLHADAPPLDEGLREVLLMGLNPPASSVPTLTAVRGLFARDSVPPTEVEGVRVLAVRDCWSEAETAAGLVQHAVAGGLAHSDIGLLLPEDMMSLSAVENVFALCGIPLSGFSRPVGRRDLGREAVRTFLLCLRKPAPIMAVASLLTSPLLPWSTEQGHELALAVMEGDVYLKGANAVPVAARQMMDLLDQGSMTGRDLRQQLKQFVQIFGVPDALRDHFQRLREVVEQLQEVVAGMQELDWQALLNVCAPERLASSGPVEYWQEGVRVFLEGAHPWCDVRHLLVLGFNEGHYPADTGSSAVFSEAEWEQIALAGWPVITGKAVRNRNRAIFARQLGSATEKATFLFSRRDTCGKAIEASSSLIFLSRSLGVDTTELVLDLDRSADVKKVADLPLADAMTPSEPRPLLTDDLELGVDLLEAFGREEGKLAPLSPSAGETLMVSPLAWLFGRLDVKPREWNTDDFDVLKQGTLAHRVLEVLFQAGKPLPSEAEVLDKVPRVLRELVVQIAPFIRSPEWRVERLKFESELMRAADHWRKLLHACKARIVATETWLRGWYGEVPLHGQSDLVVELPSGKLLVVDYKKSSSAKRRDRLRNGFDLQAHLYRLMVQTGGLPGVEGVPDEIGIVYYLLNDTTALSDGMVGSDGSVPGWEELDTDCSSQAMVHLDRRLAEVQKGTIRLNTDEDELWWDKNASQPLYALDNSPLLRLFMRSSQEDIP